MSQSDRNSDAPLFVGRHECLTELANWLSDFERATVSRASDGFYVDLRELIKVLSVGTERLGALRADEQQQCRDYVGILQRDVAILLAKGLDGVLEPSQEEQEARASLQKTLNVATPHFRWLGAHIRDKLPATVGPAETGGTSPESPATPPKERSRRSRPKADYATCQKEAELAAEWGRARDAGTHKADFAADKKMSVADLDRLLDRVAARKKSSE